MIVDVLEAKARSLHNKGQLTDIRKMVYETIDELEGDLHLDEIETKLSVWRKIKEICVDELSAIHKVQRISYPTTDSQVATSADVD